jgi:hypothetical protein
MIALWLAGLALATPGFDVSVAGAGSISLEAPQEPVSSVVGVVEVDRRTELSITISRWPERSGTFVVETSLRHRRTDRALTRTLLVCATRCEVEVRAEPATRIVYTPE